MKSTEARVESQIADENSKIDYRKAYLMERHLREKLQRACDADSHESFRTMRSYQDILLKLDEASSTLTNLGKIATECEDLISKVARLSHAIRTIAPIAMKRADSVKERIVVMQACEGLPFKLWSRINITSIRGLPRLRVFSDEVCFVKLLLWEKDMCVWSSDLFPVSQSPTVESTWQTDEAFELSLPTQIFSGCCELRFGVEFESSLIAETKKYCGQEPTAPLFHNYMPLPHGSIHFSTEPPASSQSVSVDMRVRSILNLDSFSDVTGPSRNGFRLFVLHAESGEEVELDIPSGGGEISNSKVITPKAELGAERIKLDLSLHLGSNSVAHSELHLAINQVSPKPEWISAEIVFSANDGSRTACLIVEYKVKGSPGAIPVIFRDG